MNPESQNNKSPRALAEEAVLAFWKERDIFEKTLSKESPNGEFVFYDGPPTANGMPGLHHVEPQSFKDAIPRYKTMQGFHVPRRAGWDTHGLPVELQVEKELGLKSKKEIEQYGVAAFNQKCKESVWKYKAEWMKMRTRMGFWTDLEHAYITYSNNYIEALWSVIAKADERGFLYKDFKVVPWCARCGTVLSSHELNQPGAYKDIKDLSVYVKFKVKESGKWKVEGGVPSTSEAVNIPPSTFLLAWTTTPWTLPGNVALAVGKDIEYVKVKVVDEYFILAKERLPIIEGEYEIVAEMKGTDLVGLEYEPLFSHLRDKLLETRTSNLEPVFRVYPAEFVTTTDGTGIVHTAVMYGQEDFVLGTAVGLPKFHLVNEEGKFIEGCGFLSGRYVREADENGKPTLAVDIIDDLKKRNLFFKQENIKHSYPHCWRCDTPLIYYATVSWYFRMSALREQLLAANEQINWEPEHIKEGRFGEWLDGIKDWAISRDRYWGTPLPIWMTDDGGKVVVDSLSTLKTLSKKSGNTYTVIRHGEAEHNVTETWSCTPGTNDKLTEHGKAQVARVAETLKGKIDMIISSPFTRGQETAAIIAEALGISADAIITDPRIGEWNVGSEHNGEPMESYFKIRNESTDRYRFKTDDGESYADVFSRTGACLYEVEQNYQGKNILFVTHGGSARALELVAKGFAYDTLFETTREYRNFDNAEVREILFVPLPHNESFELDFHKPYIDEIELYKDGKKLTRTKEVMDVWFDSGAMPYAQGHELGQEIDFSPAPANYISEAIDQTRGWFYTLHAVSNLVSPEARAAYKNVICLGHILDAEGKKMSKSKGNVVDPWEMFDKYGADAVRFWMYSVNQPGDSKNFDEKTLKELEGKVFTLLGNVLSFYELYRDKKVESGEWKVEESKNVLDRWILVRLDQLVGEVTESLDAFDLFRPTRATREFIDDLSTWYLRRSRDRLKDSDGRASMDGARHDSAESAKQTLYYVLKTVAQILAPFAPFTAEDMWQKLKNENDAESVHLSKWPEVESGVSKVEGGGILEAMQKVREICTLGNALRKKENIPVRQPLASLSVESGKWKVGEQYKELIKDELNVKEVIEGDETKLDTSITPELKAEGGYRELVRAVQDLRKEKGLSPSDTINLTISPQAEALLSLFIEEFKKTVQIKDLSFAENEGTEMTVAGVTYNVLI